MEPGGTQWSPVCPGGLADAQIRNSPPDWVVSRFNLIQVSMCVCVRPWPCYMCDFEDAAVNTVKQQRLFLFPDVNHLQRRSSCLCFYWWKRTNGRWFYLFPWRNNKCLNGNQLHSRNQLGPSHTHTHTHTHRHTNTQPLLNDSKDCGLEVCFFSNLV